MKDAVEVGRLLAIGSGGLTGKGFQEGTQSGLNFLPQQHTDFIYSVVSEEWGFIGSVAVIALMVLLILWAVQTAWQSMTAAMIPP